MAPPVVVEGGRVPLQPNCGVPGLDRPDSRLAQRAPVSAAAVAVVPAQPPPLAREFAAERELPRDVREAPSPSTVEAIPEELRLAAQRTR